MTYADRVRQLEAEGFTTSDAQGIADIEAQATEKQSPHEVADEWEAWCGTTKWSTALRSLGDAGWSIQWWCGYPRSRSAIPLCFSLFTPNGDKFPCESRLTDLRAAIAQAKGVDQ